ncbi:40S ribosomal protein S17-like [Iris pallida]|uniref:40S ribosomal protein S17-like n=1 Tax=Iris pallida TaxID=29817 RepID=A0AAX6E213_IRIPA|nr:40S ribosomal protein S17-like [Iris pallida]
MGRVRTKTVKKSSCQVIEWYYSRMILDFHHQQEGLGGVGHHPLQAPLEQDRRLLHPPHAPDPARPRPRDLAEAARGGEGAEDGLRPQRVGDQGRPD